MGRKMNRNRDAAAISGISTGRKNAARRALLTRVERASFPSLGKILADQIGLPDVAASGRMTEEGYKNRLY